MHAIIYFLDNNGYNILEGWCNHQTKPILQNSLEVAAEAAQSLNIRPYGSDNIGFKFYIRPYGSGKKEKPD